MSLRQLAQPSTLTLRGRAGAGVDDERDNESTVEAFFMLDFRGRSPVARPSKDDFLLLPRFLENHYSEFS